MQSNPAGNRPNPGGPQVPPLLVGPAPPAITFIGEAPGSNEELYGRPFIGYAGDLLRDLIKDAFFPTSVPSYYLTNVFKVRPERNDISLFFGNRREGLLSLPSYGRGLYLLPQYKPMLDSLLSEPLLRSSRLLIPLGNTALWALTGRYGISKLRGIILDSPLGLPILPTFHPSAVLRDESLRSLVVADLKKASDFLLGLQDPDRGKFDLSLNPKLSDLAGFVEEARSAPRISVDVETSHGQITLLGFGLSPRRAVCVPFWNPETYENYWPTVADEVVARRLAQMILENYHQPKVYHNGIYDMQYLFAEGFRPRGPVEDTMLLHHALQPEMEKSLGFLGATYTDEPEWKSLRKRKGDELVKEGE